MNEPKEACHKNSGYSPRASFLHHIVTILSTGFFSGYSPVAPGTAGTLVAVPLYFVVSGLSASSYAIFLAAFLFLSWWLASGADKVFHQRDSGRIVIDEIAGYLVATAFLEPTPTRLIFTFLLFRFFDILKPFPIRRLEGLKGAYGILADDVMAGIYSNLISRLFIYLS